MKKKHLKFLKQLVETPSPTGFEEPAASLVRERLADVADEVATDTMGSVRAVLEGRDAGAPSLMLAAHMDEIGLMVTYISDEGFLSVASLGGVDAAILPGMRVDVHTASGTLRGIVGRKPIHLIEPDERKKVTPLDKLVIDLDSYELLVDGRKIDTPPKELELLYHLASTPNRVYTRNQLLDEVWGFDYFGDSRTVDVHIKRLREKVENVSDQWALKTVWGVGYKFEVKQPS